MEIRKVMPHEVMDLWQLFHSTIRNVNVRDYTPEQVAVWAPDDVDDDKWRARIEGIDPFVCVKDDIIVGYADVQDNGYVDHFYVHHLHQRQGVGQALFNVLEKTARAQGSQEMTSNVSITARPFFEAQGFTVVRAQEVEVQGLILHNFHMRKSLA